MKNEEKKVILIVEDELPLSKAIGIKIEKSGLRPLQARSVSEAIDLLKKPEGVDVIWLDHYLLGEKNGLEFVVELKSNDEWKGIPVFVVSNTAGQEKVSAYLKLGINKYYTKSDVHLDKVIEDIKQALNVKE